jgi:hypothetical protein
MVVLVDPEGCGFCVLRVSQGANAVTRPVVIACLLPAGIVVVETGQLV